MPWRRLGRGAWALCRVGRVAQGLVGDVAAPADPRSGEGVGQGGERGGEVGCGLEGARGRIAGAHRVEGPLERGPQARGGRGARGRGGRFEGPAVEGARGGRVVAERDPVAHRDVDQAGGDGVGVEGRRGPEQIGPAVARDVVGFARRGGDRDRVARGREQLDAVERERAVRGARADVGHAVARQIEARGVGALVVQVAHEAHRLVGPGRGRVFGAEREHDRSGRDDAQRVRGAPEGVAPLGRDGHEGRARAQLAFDAEGLAQARARQLAPGALELPGQIVGGAEQLGRVEPEEGRHPRARRARGGEGGEGGERREGGGRGAAGHGGLLSSGIAR